MEKQIPSESPPVADAKASPRGVSPPTESCHPTRTAVWIALGYGIIGFLWIATSDTIASWMIADHDALSRVQTYKGWGYIFTTAVLLGLLVHMLLSRIDRSQRSMRESEMRFRLVTEAATDAIWDWNLLTNDLWWNEGVTTQFGYTPEETAGGIAWWDNHLHPNDRERVVRDLQAAIDSGRVRWADEYRFRKADGTYADVYDRGSVIHDSSGKPVRMIGGMTDITHRKRAEEALRERLNVERMLLQELDHRVRNNLTALLSLVDMTRRNVDDVSSFADRISGRVRAMANVHGLLSESRWSSLNLRSLIVAVAPAECIKRVLVEGDPQLIPSRQVTGLAMVMHELMTNSVKYGSLSTPQGTLNVSWTAHDKTPNTIVIRWREIDGPPLEGRPLPKVGTELIEGLTKTELRGKAILTFPRSGADHTLTITLDDPELDAPPGERLRQSDNGDVEPSRAMSKATSPQDRAQ